MKKVMLIAGLVFILLCRHAAADHTSMIGGARGGFGLGMVYSKVLNDHFTGRFGVEGTTGEDQSFTGDNPFLVFAGLKMPLVTIKDEPISWGLGFVANYGVRSEQGEYISLIFNKLYNSDDHFLETGLDWFGDHGHIEAQIGYRFLNY
jgi:hypothetical protein